MPANTPNKQSKILRAKDVANILGCSESSVWSWARKNPAFPKPKRFGQRFTFWTMESIEAFLRGQTANETDEVCNA